MENRQENKACQISGFELRFESSEKFRRFFFLLNVYFLFNYFMVV